MADDCTISLGGNIANRQSLYGEWSLESNIFCKPAPYLLIYFDLSIKLGL